MRADRLVATLLLIQARGRVTAAEVAYELEVSVATTRRDLEALAAAGVPIYPQRGRGGGWSLVGGARTDLTGLTLAEAQALFLLTGPASSGTPAVRSALRKLVQALPATFRADAQAAADAVITDPARWGATDRERHPLVEMLQQAVVQRRKLTIDYETRAHERSRRLVDPWGLIDKDDVWYLIAGTDDGQRTFRVDRIENAAITEIAANRPANFKLAREWERVVHEVEQHRSLVTATILIEARYLPVIRDHFGRHCEPIEMLDDGRVGVRVRAPMAISIAEQLAGWGATVEVLEPDAVRIELARIGAELVNRYDNNAASQRHTNKTPHERPHADNVSAR